MADDLNDHLAQLRALFHDDALSSTQAWRRLALTLDRWPADLDLAVALDYARQNVASWDRPDAPWSWWRARAQRHLHPDGDNPWAPYLDLVTAWHGPIDPAQDGLSPDVIADTERRLGLALPAGLKRWYLLTGANPRPSPPPIDLDDDDAPRLLLDPARLALRGDWLLLHDEIDQFSAERQATWSVHRDAFADLDPEVTLHEAPPGGDSAPEAQQRLPLSHLVLWLTLLRTVIDHPRRYDLLSSPTDPTHDPLRAEHLPDAFLADPDIFPVQPWPAFGAQPFFAPDTLVVAIRTTPDGPLHLCGAARSGHNPFAPA